MRKGQGTADYEIIPTAAGNRYRFFCALSGAVLCMTAPIRGETPEAELLLAWEREGRRCFNQCRSCGRWVGDVMYNADELRCVECAPWRETPRYCPHCGAKLAGDRALCPRCGRET